MMKPYQSLLIALACVALSATLARAQGGEVVRDEITLRGTVEAVDHTARTVRVRGDQGNVVTLDVPKSFARFSEVKQGDILTVAYSDKVSVRLKPAGEPPVDRTVDRTTTAAPGDLPAATRSSQRVQTVTLTSWDPATRVLTFTTPSGASYQRHLIDTTEANIIAGIKVGDRVDVTRTEAASVSVEPGKAAAAAPAPVVADDLRHRLTFFALWGVDNSFSGNMIKESTGTTTTGAPISLTQTTFDDVYGRIALFKLGVGYRTTPRTEATVNFLISRSSAQSVTIGTAGPNSVPLHVQFTDYNYWGIEGGQRFFFTRVRFTPYVGYLVGVNRNGDIRGTFVDAPPGATLPGLAAQDGKFFEKSWAFSVGPTAGLLIRTRARRSVRRNTDALHGRTVGRRLARRGGSKGHQCREWALVASGHFRRQISVLGEGPARGGISSDWQIPPLRL